MQGMADREDDRLDAGARAPDEGDVVVARASVVGPALRPVRRQTTVRTVARSGIRWHARTVDRGAAPADVGAR